MKQVNLKKRFLCLLLIFVLVLTGCGESERVKPRAKKNSTGIVTPTGEASPTEAVKPTEIQTPTDAPEPSSAPEPTDAPEPSSAPEPTDVPEPTEAPDPDTVKKEQERFNQFLDDYVKDNIGDSCLDVHYRLEHPEKYGIDVVYEVDFFGEYSGEEAYEIMEGYKDELLTFVYDFLTEPQKVYYDNFMYEYEFAKRYRNVKEVGCSLLSENGNIMNSITSNFMEYPFLEEKDLEDYIKILEANLDLPKQTVEAIVKQCEKGGTVTQDMYDTAMDDYEDLRKKEDNIMDVMFRYGAKSLGLDDDVCEDYIKRFEDVLFNQWLPAWDAIEDDVYALDKYVSENPLGLAKFEGGAEYYAYQAQAITCSDLDPDAMFEYIRGWMDKMTQKLQEAYMMDMSVMQRYMSGECDYPESDMGTILETLKTNAEKRFGKLKNSDFVASEMPEEIRTPSIGAYYMYPQWDNPSGKVIRVNPDGELSNTEKYMLLTHEGFPGHLYQFEYFRESEGYHDASQLFTYLGYVEGWATFMGTESYADANGGDKALAILSDYDYTYGMAMASLIDIAINYKGWSLEEVKNYFKADPVLAAMVMNVDYLADLVYSDPGLYLSYCYSNFQVQDIIAELMETKGMTEDEACIAYLNVGPCSMSVLRKHLGLSPEIVK